MLDLLLQAENLLRKRVDFDILLVNLLRQAEELGGFRSARGASGALGVGVDRKRDGEKKNREGAEEPSHGAKLGTSVLCWQAGDGLRFGCIHDSVFLCQNGRKNR